MKNLFDKSECSKIKERILKLSPDANPAWGKLNAHTMIVHLSDSLKCALGERPAKIEKSFFSVWPVNLLISQILPWPKGAPTAQEFLQGSGGSPLTDFNSDRDELIRLIERFPDAENKISFPVHPAFGKLSNKQYAKLLLRHTDHHLRQFGV